MNSIKQKCVVSGQDFLVTQKELQIIERISPTAKDSLLSIPPPKVCPELRLMTRLAFINQVYLYNLKCSSTGKNIFSYHSPDSPYPVYDNQIWWGDSWDASSYGRDFNFELTFFKQFQALETVVPHLALQAQRNENCAYLNNASDNKNCYLIFNTSFAEDCQYCENVWHSIDCVDCTFTKRSELCYDCISCNRCYNLQSSIFSDDCSDSFFLQNCRACKNCFGCVNLHRKQYCFFNQQLTKDQYFLRINELDLSSISERKKITLRFQELVKTMPMPNIMASNVERANGNLIYNSADIANGFFINEGEFLYNCMNLDTNCKNCVDLTAFGNQVSFVYDSIRIGHQCQKLAFCQFCFNGSSDLYYCKGCYSCKNCFGCVGLRHKQYCILNKQYSKENYENLLIKIVGHMRGTSEWGRFFPINLSHIPYNRSFAKRYFTKNKEEVLSLGLKWHFEEAIAGAERSQSIPDKIPEGVDSLILQSNISGKAFKVTKHELDILRSRNLPLPTFSYDERMEIRALKMGSVKLRAVKSAKTGHTLQTAFRESDYSVIWEKEHIEREMF